MAGRYRAPRFHLVFGPPVGSSLSNNQGFIDTSPDASQLQFTTSVQGGFDTATIAFDGAVASVNGRRVRFADLDYLKPLWDCTVTPGTAIYSVGGPVAFNGRVMIINHVAGVPEGVQVVGYGKTGMNDSVLTTGSGAATTSGAVLKAMLGSPVAAGPTPYWIDPGVSHTSNDYLYYAPAQVLDQIIKEGGTTAGAQSGGSALWDGMVYEGRQLRLVPRIPPASIVYTVPHDSRVAWSDDYTDAVSSVLVRYTVPGQTVTPAVVSVYGPVVSGTFLAKFGVTRTILLEGAGLPSAAAAQQFANTYLAIHQDSYATVTVTRTEGDGVETGLGGETSPWLVRAGQWMKVGDNQPLIITRTNYDGVKGQLTLTLNSQPADLLARVKKLIDLSRYTVKQTTPLTGVRLSSA